MRLEQKPPPPRFVNRRRLCNRYAIVHNPYVGSIQSEPDTSMDRKPPCSPATLAMIFTQSTNMFGMLSISKNDPGCSGGEWRGRTATDVWPCVSGGWSGGVSQERLLPRSTKRNAYVGIIRHAPATTNGLKDIWDDSNTSNRRNRSGPLLSQIDIGNRMNSSRLSPSDLGDLPLIEFTMPPSSPPKPANCPGATTVDGPSNDCVHDRCVICLASFQPNDQLRALPCHHAFHRKCIDRWLLGGCTDSSEPTNFCPTCRTVIKPAPSDPPVQPKEVKAESDEPEESDIPAWSFLMLGARLHTMENPSD